MFAKSIRFLLKKQLYRHIVLPKTSSLVECSDALTVSNSANKVANYWETDATHRCTFQPLLFTLRDTLKRLVYGNKMESNASLSCLKPPECVKCMVQLDKVKFTKVVKVPSVVVRIPHFNSVGKLLKRHLMKVHKVKPVVELTKCDPRFSNSKRCLLDPEKITDYESLLKVCTFPHKDFEMAEVELRYENWTFQEVMQAIMPDNMENVVGFTQVGHIAHFNLREQALPYKNIIGQVLLDKLSIIKTVVNKVDTIDSTFRTFQMELLAGENNFVTQVKENGMTLELDFSKVYWNSRLATEHGRMTEHLSSNDIVFDVFAGIGPFAIPAVKRKAIVFANDLNPSSYESLVKNVKLNKCDSSRIKCYNMDGREFINSIMKNELEKIYSVPAVNVEKEANSLVEKYMCSSSEDTEDDRVKEINSISVLMNLPGLAHTFLDAYVDLLRNLNKWNSNMPLTTVHCYCFTNVAEADAKFDGDVDKELKHRTINKVRCLEEGDITVRYVRDVAPKKIMKCVSFELTQKLLCSPVTKGKKVKAGKDEPPKKRLKLKGMV